MQPREFLASVLPDKGWYCAAGIRNGLIEQDFVATVDAIIVDGESFSAHKTNAYFALSNFRENKSRTQANAATTRAFFLDMDCKGDSKSYEDQGEALEELKGLQRDLQLPSPVIIDSGHGLHVYWPLQEPVESQAWRAVANGLKSVCKMRRMRVDYAVPADQARLLRIPGTINYNGTTPKKVEFLKDNYTPESFEFFKQKFGFKPSAEVPQILADYKAATFSVILKRPREDICQQLLHIVEHQEDIDEPLWRAGLSIAQCCEDRHLAIHTISKKHPKYNRNETIRKAVQTKGPYLCETFAMLSDYCTPCKHNGKIKSPIILGYQPPIAAPEVNQAFSIPPFPDSYVRKEGGGVIRRGGGGDGDDSVDKEVFDSDYFANRLIDDPELGASVEMSLKLPRENMRSFLLPFQYIANFDEFRKQISIQGVSCNMQTAKELNVYTHKWIAHLQKQMKAQPARHHFGWNDNQTLFVVGERAIYPRDIRHSPASSYLINLADKFDQQGSIEEWVKVINFYNQSGMESYQLVFLMAFGSPLVEFLGEPGGTIHLHSVESGSGKTTLLKAINSVFGHPTNAMLLMDDTRNAREHRLGLMRNIATCVDEVTHRKNEQFSAEAYAQTSGRGKERMMGSVNRMRKNLTQWYNILIQSANKSATEGLELFQHSPEAQKARMIEFYLEKPNISKVVADANFIKLKDNYGLAGDLYVQFLLKNLPTVKMELMQYQKQLDVDAGFGQAQRFWSVMLTAALYGGKIARTLGLVSFDINRLRQWAIPYLHNVKRNTKTLTRMDITTIIGAFIQEHMDETIIVNSVGTSKIMLPMPTLNPKGNVLVRFEPDVRMLYLSMAHFREHLSKRNLTYSKILEMLKAYQPKEMKKRIGKGGGVDINVLVLALHDPTGAIYGEPVHNGSK